MFDVKDYDQQIFKLFTLETQFMAYHRYLERTVVGVTIEDISALLLLSELYRSIESISVNLNCKSQIFCL